MLRSRIIPCLLIDNGALIKTEVFGNPKYVGDPINAVKIFNEKLVDELMIIDIDATVKKLDPNYELIRKIAAESQMPISYTGGIKSVEQVKKIIGYGVEKVGISSSAISNPDLILNASKEVGSQSIVIVLDVKKKFLGGYSVYTHNGKIDTGHKFENLVKNFVEKDVGEFVINSIDNVDYSQPKELGIDKCLRQCNGICTQVGYNGIGSCIPVEKTNYGTLYKNPTFTYGLQVPYYNKNNESY